TASFKERGAANRLMTLTGDDSARGVIAMSAGNHAQAVAYHAQRLGIAATIVMPKPTPFVKVSRTRHHAARVLLEGETLAEAEASQALSALPVSVGGVTLAEGIAVRDVGRLPLSILRAHNTDVMVVAERLIEQALILLIEIEKTVAEGAGSAALAAVLANPKR